MDEAERQARECWKKQGVDHATQDQILADLTAKTHPGAWVSPFQITHENPTVRTERTKS